MEYLVRSYNRTNEYFNKKATTVNRQVSPVFDLLVSRRGIEPLWALAHWILNPARLPVPPPRHMLLRLNILACNAVDFISKLGLWQEDISFKLIGEGTGEYYFQMVFNLRTNCLFCLFKCYLPCKVSRMFFFFLN